jgi:spore coat polysaccharide biosynthesis predicted glycosyltransferase SpsG
VSKIASIWIRARSGPALGMGHRVRADILAEALTAQGCTAGLILDHDAPEADSPVHRLPEGALPPEELAHYPPGRAPVILDLSHPAMAPDLPQLVQALKAQERSVGLIDGLGAEAYVTDLPEADPDLVLTPYVLEPGATPRSARVWVCGPDHAVLDPAYAQVPELAASARAKHILVSISGTDPWSLTEGVASALLDGGLPEGWTASVIAGPGFDGPRIAMLQRLIGGHSDVDLVIAPRGLRPSLVTARLAILGPGLAKYEAAACGTYSLILSPDQAFADMNRPFEAEGLATVLRAGVPSPTALRQAITVVDPGAIRDPRGVIDGQGASRAAARFVSELFTESRDT